ncbi:DUF1697 domain-containing protein [Rhizobium sp. LjRoot254]|uniref:DUF1697 domain-containing protein n=1 Tax=Rhizobium sp. LjRoot254 TaxID=3342297 RepID=UPI003ECEDD18
MNQTYIALLRGINVGGKVLKMADLRQAVAGLGFEDVKTYLQSGNMVFRAPKASNAELAERIASAIKAHKAMDVKIMVRSVREWDHVITDNPYLQAEEKPKTVHAFILDDQPGKDRIAILRTKDAGSEEWTIVGDALYLHTPEGLGQSVLGNIIERTLKVPMTARNWNTVKALMALAGSL